MQLYRPFVSLGPGQGTEYHDAVASLHAAIEYANAATGEAPGRTSWIEQETWPTLSRLQYFRHRTLGTHGGFGTEFQKRYGHRHTATRVVWPEAAVLQSLAKASARALPQCEGLVLVASPSMDGSYRCEVRVRAVNLVAFAENARDSTFGGPIEGKIARHALPIWLKRANPHSQATIELPASFREIVAPYVLNFIQDGEAQVKCLACDAVVLQVESGLRNQARYGQELEWTSSWKCQSGHNLYARDFQVKLL